MPILTLRFQMRHAAPLIVLLCIATTAQEVPAVPANVVPQGTVLLIQLADRLDTRTAKAGDHFRARLSESLVAENGRNIRSGTKIKGHISAVEPGLRTRIILSFEEIETDSGWVPLIATVTGVPGEHGLKQIGEEGEIGRQGMNKEHIAEAIVVGAGRGRPRARRLAGSAVRLPERVRGRHRERCRLLRQGTISCWKKGRRSKFAWIVTSPSHRGRRLNPYERQGVLRRGIILLGAL
jgi:hypothetical protein